MKIIVAFFSISLFSLLTGFVEFRQNLECSHCQYITKFESSKYVNPDQPKPYLHDKDSTLMIYPIVENADNPGFRYIRDIKFVYKDLHYCSDVSKITTQKVIIENLVTDNIYEYELKDSLYFIKVYKIEDYVEKPLHKDPVFTPKKSGWIK